MINNSKVGMDYIKKDIKIYGPLKSLLSGTKTASRQTQFINCQVQLPIAIFQHHKYLKLFMDMFYVNRIPFLITKPNKVNYITVSHLKNRSKKIIIKAINMVKRTYLTRGFKISDYHSDNEFDNDDIRLILLPGQLQVCAKDEYVPRI